MAVVFNGTNKEGALIPPITNQYVKSWFQVLWSRGRRAVWDSFAYHLLPCHFKESDETFGRNTRILQKILELLLPKLWTKIAISKWEDFSQDLDKCFILMAHINFNAY